MEAPESAPDTPLVERKDPLVEQIRSARSPSSHEASMVEDDADMASSSTAPAKHLPISAQTLGSESPPKLPVRHGKEDEGLEVTPPLPRRNNETTSNSP